MASRQAKGRQRSLAAPGGRGTGDDVHALPTPTVEAPPEPTPAELLDCADAIQTRRPLHLLVVDDHADSADALAHLLRHEGYEVAMARTVAEAFRLALAAPVDVLLSDIDLTDGDGCELLRRVRAVHARVRGIAVSGHTGARHVKLCRDAGYERVLLKPVLFDDLLAVVASPPTTLGGVPAPETSP